MPGDKPVINRNKYLFKINDDVKKDYIPYIYSEGQTIGIAKGLFNI